MATHSIHPSAATRTRSATGTRPATEPATATKRAAAELRSDLPWLLLSVGTALGAAVATSAWMIENIHLF